MYVVITTQVDNVLGKRLSDGLITLDSGRIRLQSDVFDGRTRGDFGLLRHLKL